MMKMTGPETLKLPKRPFYHHGLRSYSLVLAMMTSVTAQSSQPSGNGSLPFALSQDLVLT